MRRLLFGQHKNEPIESVPEAYLQWLLGQAWVYGWTKDAIYSELDRRTRARRERFLWRRRQLWERLHPEREPGAVKESTRRESGIVSDNDLDDAEEANYPWDAYVPGVRWEAIEDVSPRG